MCTIPIFYFIMNIIIDIENGGTVFVSIFFIENIRFISPHYTYQYYTIKQTGYHKKKHNQLGSIIESVKTTISTCAHQPIMLWKELVSLIDIIISHIYSFIEKSYTYQNYSLQHTAFKYMKTF